MRSDVAICYVTDVDFLQPTLVSTVSLRRFVPPESARIYIFVIDVDDALIREVQRVVAHLAIEFVPLSGSAFQQVDAQHWNRPGNPLASSNVPPSTMGRLFMGEALPATVSRILYVDGDTLFVGDPCALLCFDLPEGRFAAAEDVVSLRRNDRSPLGEAARSYLDGLGLSGTEGYFNGGVFVTSRKAWREITSEALCFLHANMDKCLYYEQSALNAVVGSRRLRMSNMWNFQTRMRLWNCERLITPKILHFTEFPKPWMAPIGPWAALYPMLGALAKDLAPLGLPVRALTSGELAELVDLHQSWKGRLRSRLDYRVPLRRQALRRIEARALV